MTIWQIFNQMVESNQIDILPGKGKVIWQSTTGKTKVTVQRRKDDRLILIAKNGRIRTSRPLARLSSKFNYSGTTYSWQLTDNAEKLYSEFAKTAK